MKKVLAVVFVCLFLACCGGGNTGTVMAQQNSNIPFDQLGFVADRTNGIAGIRITGYSGIGGSLTIQREINRIPIRFIGNETFRAKKIFSVVIPDSVVIIGEGAFRDNIITSVTIPNTVTTIGENAFRNNLLTSVTIPNSVTEIGDYAFRNNLITSVTFQRSIAEFEYIVSNPIYFPFDGDLANKFTAGGAGTYTRPNAESNTWTKQ